MLGLGSGSFFPHLAVLLQVVQLLPNGFSLIKNKNFTIMLNNIYRNQFDVDQFSITPQLIKEHVHPEKPIL